MKRLILFLAVVLNFSCSNDNNTEQEGREMMQGTQWASLDSSILQGAFGKSYLEQELSFTDISFELIQKNLMHIEGIVVRDDTVVIKGIYICTYPKIELTADDLYMVGQLSENELSFTTYENTHQPYYFKKISK